MHLRLESIALDAIQHEANTVKARENRDAAARS